MRGAVDDIISTRRLVDIVNAFKIFGEKEKALAMCLARFDDDTKEAFMSLYGKVDADANMNDAGSTEVPDTNTLNTNTDCPF